MIRIIQFGVATLQSRRQETACKGGRPCSRFLSLLIVALLALPSFAHDTEHHRVTADILEEILELRDDVDKILEEIGGGNGNTGNGNTGNGNTGNGNTGNGNTGSYYGALSQDLLDDCRDVRWAINWDHTSRQSAKNAAVSGCVTNGGDTSDCTRYTIEFGSAYGNGTQYRCVALVVGGLGTRSCGTRSAWGASEASARSLALSKCRSAGYSTCASEVSQCTSPR